jgi:hypothetical protein
MYNACFIVITPECIVSYIDVVPALGNISENSIVIYKKLAHLSGQM